MKNVIISFILVSLIDSC